jgi:hypothetical protein
MPGTLSRLPSGLPLPDVETTDGRFGLPKFAPPLSAISHFLEIVAATGLWTVGFPAAFPCNVTFVPPDPAPVGSIRRTTRLPRRLLFPYHARCPAAAHPWLLPMCHLLRIRHFYPAVPGREQGHPVLQVSGGLRLWHGARPDAGGGERRKSKTPR